MSAASRIAAYRRGALYANTEAALALRQASTRLVDMLEIGDSNQLFNGYGYMGGLSKALVKRFGLYATQLGFGNGGGGGNNQPVANALVITGITSPTAADGTMTGVDATLAAFGGPGFAVGEGTPSAGYGFVASGSSIAAGTQGGLIVGNVAGVNVSARWRFWYTYGTFSTGSGSWKPEIRLGGSPFSTLASASLISTNTGSETKVTGNLDISAATRTTGLEFRTTRPGGTAITGPFILYWLRAQNLDATTGISTSTIYGAGGQSLYDMAYQFINVSDTFLTNYFTELRRLQVAAGLDPLLVVYISSGANDRNETGAPSLGPNPASPGNSAAAYADNLTGLINRIEAIYTAQGWNLANLQFLVIPTHPISDPNDSQIVSYTAAAQAYAATRSRVTVVDLTQLITFATIKAMPGIDSGGVPHLQNVAYDAISELICASLGL